MHSSTETFACLFDFLAWAQALTAPLHAISCEVVSVEPNFGGRGWPAGRGSKSAAEQSSLLSLLPATLPATSAREGWQQKSYQLLVQELSLHQNHSSPPSLLSSAPPPPRGARLSPSLPPAYRHLRLWQSSISHSQRSYHHLQNPSRTTRSGAPEMATERTARTQAKAQQQLLAALLTFRMVELVHI